jgi:hypothetical protein
MLYYKASAIIAAFTDHPLISIDYTDPAVPFPRPSCPKPSDPDHHCRDDFPSCEGKKVDCRQKLLLKTRKGENPIIVYLFYYIDRQNREGRIKKQNTTLAKIKNDYGLNMNPQDEFEM